eukprot:TRINITY_DN58539_c0_g1_i1.p1 TRINITY_DN58539_c0_g1~~TRINITY_DN58539_c0_g1_i1.p1  ORF type:complete len:1417 (-),score=160.11 TRINITY_DN58539_c0_g1_i1:52-4302(-)
MSRTMYYYNSGITTYTPKVTSHCKSEHTTRPSSASRTTSAPKQRRRKKAVIYIDTTQCRHDLVRQCAADMGWQEAGSHEPNVVWIDGAITADKILKPYRFVNHFPSMNLISRKVDMARHLNKIRRSFPKEFGFYPQSWISHQDWLRSPEWHDSGMVYIVKPNTGSQGKGIKLVKHPMKHHFDDAVVQEYIPNPMLIEGYKFDIRVYVLVLSCDPLKILLYQNGLVRLCTEKYDLPSSHNMQSMCTHLTNYSVNKRSDKFVFNDDQHDFSSGSKRDFRFLNQYLTSLGFDVGEMWHKVQDVIVKSVISIHHILRHVYRATLPEHSNLGTSCFELLGFDILLDSQLNPWLIEVNQAPSFAADTPLDLQIKYGAVMETMELLGLDCEEYSRLKHFQQLAQSSQRVVSAYTTTAGWGITPQGGFSPQFIQQFQARREQYESKVMKGFKRIFPCDHKRPETTEKYRQLMNHVRATDTVYGSPHIPPQLQPVSYSATLHPPPSRSGRAAANSSTISDPNSSMDQSRDSSRHSWGPSTQKSLASTLRSMRAASASPSRRAAKKVYQTKRRGSTSANGAAGKHADHQPAAQPPTDTTNTAATSQTATVTLTSTSSATPSTVGPSTTQPATSNTNTTVASSGRKRRLPVNPALTAQTSSASTTTPATATANPAASTTPTPATVTASSATPKNTTTKALLTDLMASSGQPKQDTKQVEGGEAVSQQQQPVARTLTTSLVSVTPVNQHIAGHVAALLSQESTSGAASPQSATTPSNTADPVPLSVSRTPTPTLPEAIQAATNAAMQLHTNPTLTWNSTTSNSTATVVAGNGGGDGAEHAHVQKTGEAGERDPGAPRGKDNKLMQQLLYLQKLQQQEQQKLIQKHPLIPSRQHKNQHQVVHALLEEKRERSVVEEKQEDKLFQALANTTVAGSTASTPSAGSLSKPQPNTTTTTTSTTTTSNNANTNLNGNAVLIKQRDRKTSTATPQSSNTTVGTTKTAAPLEAEVTSNRETVTLNTTQPSSTSAISQYDSHSHSHSHPATGATTAMQAHAQAPCIAPTHTQPQVDTVSPALTSGSFIVQPLTAAATANIPTSHSTSHVITTSPNGVNSNQLLHNIIALSQQQSEQEQPHTTESNLPTANTTTTSATTKLPSSASSTPRLPAPVTTAPKPTNDLIPTSSSSTATVPTLPTSVTTPVVPAATGTDGPGLSGSRCTTTSNVVTVPTLPAQVSAPVAPVTAVVTVGGMTEGVSSSPTAKTRAIKMKEERKQDGASGKGQQKSTKDEKSTKEEKITTHPILLPRKEQAEQNNTYSELEALLQSPLAVAAEVSTQQREEKQKPVLAPKLVAPKINPETADEEKMVLEIASPKLEPTGDTGDVLDMGEWLDCLNEWNPTVEQQAPTATTKSKFQEMRGLPRQAKAANPRANVT